MQGHCSCIVKSIGYHYHPFLTIHSLITQGYRSFLSVNTPAIAVRRGHTSIHQTDIKDSDVDGLQPSSIVFMLTLSGL